MAPRHPRLLAHAAVLAALSLAPRPTLARTLPNPTTTQVPDGSHSPGSLPAYLPALLARGSFPHPAPGSPGPGPTPRPTATLRPPGLVALNEVGFKPPEGAAPFVELVNLGPGAADVAGLALTNRLTETYRLPAALPALPPEGLLLVVFDGANRLEPGIVHADRAGLVDPDGDRLVLAGAGGTWLDEVAWGRGERRAVPLGPGGVVPPAARGSSLGRLPGATSRAPEGWARYQPADASPGRPNALPVVEAFPMIDGLVTAERAVTLAWYPAPGASGYRVQVAVDEAFTAPLADTGAVSATFRTPALAPGSYYWRVQPTAPDGAVGRFSRPLRLTVEEAAGPLLGATAENRLAVPIDKQRKDTRMLLLESTREKGPHAWDAAHPDLATFDLADRTNCGLATVAMVATYYGGNLSQDRIGYERFRGDEPGPELDLKWGQDINGFDVIDLLQWAVGPGVVAYWAVNSVDTGRDDPAERAAFWETVKISIDNGQPLAVCGGGHCVVVTGYVDGLLSRKLYVNDPWLGQITVRADSLALLMYAIPPVGAAARSDEPTIATDSDGDGIVDFDEIERFGTNPGAKDTDGDEVADKDEVRMSAFDGDHAYAFWGDARNDIDRDDTAPELDDDSDDGGCIDGLEDLDHNGRILQDGSETSPYEKGDDKCIFGTWRMWNDQTVPLAGGGFERSWVDIAGRFSVKPTESGQLEGHGTFTHDQGGEVRQQGNCAQLTYDMPLIRWESDLTGTFKENDVVIDPAPTTGHGTLTARDNCGNSATGPVTAGWPGGGGTLVDGVYDKRYDYPLGPGATGEFYITIHIEQSRPEDG